LRNAIEECPVVAVLLCRQLRRGTSGIIKQYVEQQKTPL
jgi:hypothetical protein